MPAIPPDAREERGRLGAGAPDAASRRAEGPDVQAGASVLDDSLRRRLDALPADRRELALLLLREQGYANTPLTQTRTYPLSYSQERMWVLDQFDQGGSAYSIPGAVQVDGELDLPALRSMVAALVERHPVLRTTFGKSGDGALRQHVHASMPVPVRLVDLSALGPNATAENERVTAVLLREPFSLGRGPLLRVALIRLRADQHVVVFVMHHIVADGWSASILMREMASLYSASLTGGEAELAPLSLTYGEFALWQRQPDQSAAHGEQLDYWRKRLSDAPRSSELPSDRPRPGSPVRAGRQHRFELPVGLTGAAHRLARALGVTPFAVLLAGFKLLLSLYTGRDDVVVGTSVANRPRRDLEDIVGCFVNSLALRTRLDHRQDFATTVREVHATVSAALSNQDVPFERVVEAVLPDRDHSGAPLFQVMFVLQNATIGEMRLPGMAFRPLAIQAGTTRFDLTMELSYRGDLLAAAIEYDAQLFDARTIEGMAGHYADLLDALIGRPDAPMVNLDVRVDARRPAPARPEPGARAVHETISQLAATAPDAPALAHGEVTLSFGELDRRADIVARALRGQGLRAGDAVAIRVDAPVEAVVAQLAAFKAGIVILVLPRDLQRDPAAWFDAYAIDLIVCDEQIPGPTRHGIRALAWSVLQDAPRQRCDPADLTHPSTYPAGLWVGRVDGVVEPAAFSHRALLAAAHESPGLHVLSIGSESTQQTTPEVWPVLCSGGRWTFGPDASDPASLVRFLRDRDIGHLRLPALLFNRLAGEQPDAFSGLHSLAIGEGAISPHRLAGISRACPRLRIQRSFDAGASSGMLCEGEVDAGPTVLRSGPGVEFWVLDAHLRPVPVGARGRIFIGGEGLAQYVGGAASTASRLMPHPRASQPGQRLCGTASEGRNLAQGSVELLGPRRIRGGRESGLAPIDVENALYEHIDVNQAFIVLDGEGASAYVATRAKLTEDALRAHLAVRLPADRLPRSINIVPAIVLRPDGGADLEALPFPRRDSSPPREPGAGIERILAQAWEDVLSAKSIGIDDDFFALGGDSILAIQIVARLREHGLALMPKDVFQARTIAGLARVAASAATVAHARPSESAEPATPVAHFPLSPIQREFFETTSAGDRSRYVHSLLVDVPADVSVRDLHRVSTWLYRRHDALRLRFAAAEERWTQCAEPPREGAGTLVEVDLRMLSAEDDAKASAALGADAWKTVDAFDGPIWRMIVLRRSSGSRQLLLVSHHLAVDAVSWRILLGELARAAAGAMDLPPPRTSWQRWVTQLQQRLPGSSGPDPRALWRAQKHAASEAFAFLHDSTAGTTLDSGSPVATAAARGTRVVWLEHRQTASLLGAAASAGAATIEDRVLYAFARTLADSGVGNGAWIELESHGREITGAGDDVSGTVGWFTTSFPMFIPCDADAAQACERIAASRVALREAAIGYGLLRASADPEIVALPRAQVGFNYLGRLDDDAGFAPASLPAGEDGSRYWSTRTHDLDASVIGGRLRLAWTFRNDLYAAAEIACMQQGLVGHLHALVSRDGEGVEERYRLTPMQEGMLLHSVFVSPGTAARYIEQVGFSLQGDLDPERLRQAWQLAVDRHPALRTCFEWRDLSEPEQRVLSDAPVDFRLQDWRDLAEDSVNRQRRWSAFLDEDAAQAFELQRAPPLRITLIRLDEVQHRCVWSFHHALLDGWSMPIVLQEVFEFYRALERGRVAARMPAPRFGAYLAWLERQDQDAMRAYWHAQLQGLVSPTPLPAARSTGDRGDGEHRLELSERSTARLQRWCREQQLTMGTVALGLWGIVLGRYAGSEDVVAGCTVSGRPPELADAERMVGLFINTLPCRIRIDPRARAGDWLRRLQSQQALSRENGYLSARDIHRCSAMDDGRALFESIVVFENYPVADQDPPTGLRVEDVWVAERVNFPLLLMLLPGERLTLKAKFDRSCFEPLELQQVLAHYLGLFDALVAGADTDVSTLTLMDPAGLAAQWSTWDASTPTPPRDAWTHQLIEAMSRSAPDAIAVVEASGTLSYGELAHRADAFSRRLSAMGVGRGDVVPLLYGPGAPAIISILSILHVGAAYAPLDPDTPRQRLHQMLADIGGKLVVCERAHVEGLPSAIAFLCVEDAVTQEPVASKVPAPGVAVSGDDLAYVLHTSGSTGGPKGVMVTHRGLANYLLWCTDAYGMADGIGAPLHSSLAFDLSVTSLLGPLVAGRAVHALPKTDGLQALTHVLRGGAGFSLVKMTPSHLELVERVLGEDASAQPPARLVIGGESLSGERLRYWRQRAPATRIVNEYGPTETVVGCCTHALAAGLVEDGPVPIGRPIANTRLRIVDAQWRLKPAGAPGELWIGGAGVARGYLSRPGATAERFVPDPFSNEPGARMYRSGDAATIDADGVLHYRGRLDSQLKLRGYRVEPAEIERALLACGGVRQAAVCVDAHKDLHAVVVPTVGIAAADAQWEAELRRDLETRLPDFMMPARLHAWAALPLTRNGKVDLAVLVGRLGSAVDHADTEADASWTGPIRTRAGLQAFVVDLWRRILRRETIGLDESFFDLGGHSLLLVRVQDAIEGRTGARLSLLDLFGHSTVRALSAHLQQRLHATSQAPAPDTDQDEAPPQAAGKDEGRIAIVGMAGRFPGADGVESFWRNLEAGVESIRFFDDAELRAAGVPEALLSQPGYVRASGHLDDADMFDHGFFEMSPREADILDPQHRLFLECAQQALDAAGYDPFRYPGDIAVYAGTFLSSYLIHHLACNPDIAASTDVLQLVTSNDKDFLATRVSYKLGLRGPAVGVQSACSSSLAAVHMASRALRDRSCDMALAGGVSIRLPLVAGHLHQPGGVLSQDGHCRAFDAEGTGFVGGSGCAIVVLKRFEDAVRDRDEILAVLHGSALNNDGAQKMGFSAPSSLGQSRVVRAALADAGVAAGDISYIEAHGTATHLGDPVEMEALRTVFSGAQAGTCAIGSVKTNIGHLDAAAGVAGLVKTVQQLRHRKLAASLHYASPNPALELDGSPFHVNARLRDWQDRGGKRLACVNSFGMGGTNVSVVVGEAPGRTHPRNEGGAGTRSLLLSARTPAALSSMMEDLAGHLDRHPDSDLDDVAYTLAVGRRAFPYRRSLACRTREDAVRALRSPLGEAHGVDAACELVFVFGDISPFSAEQIDWLRSRQPVFAAALARCLAPWGSAGTTGAGPSGTDLPPSSRGSSAFAVQYAMCALWRHWGVQPDAALGSGIGALVAATAAGALALEDALDIVRARHAGAPEHWDRVAIPGTAIPCALDDAGHWTAEPEQVRAWLRAATLDAAVRVRWQAVLSRPGMRACVVLCDAAHLRESVPGVFDADRVQRLWLSSEAIEESASGGPPILGDMWASGLEVDWMQVFARQARRRLPLPSYPFQRQRHWIDAQARPAASPEIVEPREGAGAISAARVGVRQWFHQRRWEREDPLDAPATALEMENALVLSRTMHSRFLRELGEALCARGARRLDLDDPDGLGDAGAVAVGDAAGVSRILALHAASRIFYLHEAAPWARADDALRDVAALAICARQHGSPPITIVTRSAFDVTGEESLSPAAAALLGLARVIPYEHPGQSVRLVDAGSDAPSRQLLDELSRRRNVELAAVRGHGVWLEHYRRREPHAGRSAGFRRQGRYLIIGAGAAGTTLARHLAREYQARLILVARGAGPESDSGLVAALEACGGSAEIVPADLSDREAMQAAFARGDALFGGIDGVLMAAGVRVAGSLADLDADGWRRQLHIATDGLPVLAELVDGRALDFCLVLSSLSSAVGLYGLPGYPAAHVYLEAFAQDHNRDAARRWTVLSLDNWDTAQTGEGAADTERMSREQGLEVIEYALAAGAGAWTISVSDLGQRRAALARMRQMSPNGARSLDRNGLSRPFRAPRSDLEATLCAIWEECLGIPSPGVEDNFFELGGDSVASLQVLARCNALGIGLTPRQVLEHQTIAELAVAADAGRRQAAPAEAFEGDALLAPIQHWFFEHGFSEPAHWNQARRLRLRRRVPAPVLRDAIGRLLAHHETLRSRYVQVDGAWRQSIAAPADAVPFTAFDFSALARPAYERATEAAAEALQRSLRLDAGPLLRVALFDGGDANGQETLVILHHLVCDAWSWRILLEDLAALCADPEVPLAATSPHRQWVVGLRDYADAMSAPHRLRWREALESGAAALPADRGAGDARETEDSLRSIEIVLSRQETSALHTAARQASTSFNDVLVGALVRALGDWADAGQILIEFEGLGRDAPVGDLDLSRTIGWFTSPYPVLFDTHQDDWRKMLAHVRDRLGGVPDRGIGYGALRYLAQADAAALAWCPRAQIGFVYLGQIESAPASPEGLFLPSPGTIGTVRSPDARLPYTLAVTALIDAGALRVHLLYSERRFQISTVQSLADRCRAGMLEFIHDDQP